MPTAVPITVQPLPATFARDPAAGLLKRIVILATASFAIGFAGFMAFDMAAVGANPALEPVAAIEAPAPQAAPAALPASDDWNLPKRI